MSAPLPLDRPRLERTTGYRSRDGYSLTELRDHLKRHGLGLVGTKEVLKQRLLDHLDFLSSGSEGYSPVAVGERVIIPKAHWRKLAGSKYHAYHHEKLIKSKVLSLSKLRLDGVSWGKIAGVPNRTVSDVLAQAVMALGRGEKPEPTGLSEGEQLLWTRVLVLE